VLRRPGLAASLQVEYRVSIAGPTTLGALLNSLQMGFRTLAIQQRSSEVWTVLSEVKGEFGKFSDVLAKVKTKLEQASKEIEQTEVRTRVINRRLREVQELPAADVARLLPPKRAENGEGTEDETGILPFARTGKVDK
jgi:DNA recombination protein RmuC